MEDWVREELRRLPTFPCAIADKSPLTPHGHLDARRGRDCSGDPLTGVACGEASKFDVLDVDPDGMSWLAQQSLFETRTHRTRRGGYHFLFHHVPGLRCSTSKIAPGIDVKAEGGFCIWWPKEGFETEFRDILCEWPDYLLKQAMHTHAHGGQEESVLRAPFTSTGKLNALSSIDPTKYQDHDDWLRLMMSAKVVGVCREDFVAWSVSDPLYADDAEIIRRRWDHYQPDGRVTEATLFWALRREPAAPIPPTPKGRRNISPRDRIRMTAILAKVTNEDKLFWAACRFGECRMAVKIKDNILEDLLLKAGWRCGLRDKRRMRRQIRNGFRLGATGKWE
jgi:hypothetical protein